MIKYEFNVFWQVNSLTIFLILIHNLCTYKYKNNFIMFIFSSTYAYYKFNFTIMAVCQKF